jgi:microcystin-dependent protein
VPIDFPSSPTEGQIYTYLDKFWLWNGVTWDPVDNYLSDSVLPAGSIIQWVSNTLPANWLLCDGSAVSRSTYSSLFAAIGTQYGVGDGTATFNLPNLKGRVAVGRDSAQTEFDVLGETGGAKTHTLTTAQMPSHTHTQDSHNHTQNAHSHPVGGSGSLFLVNGGGTNGGANVTVGGGSYAVSVSQSTTATNNPATATNQNTGGGGAHNNLQPYQVFNYIIKASAGTTSGDSELATRVGAVETANATTNKSGLVPTIPTSVTTSSGSASINTTTGVITFTGVNVLNINGAFSSAYNHYKILHVSSGSSSNTGVGLQMRASGTNYTTANQKRHIAYFGANTVVTTSAGSDSADSLQIGWVQGSPSSLNSHSFEIFNPFNSTQTVLTGTWHSYVSGTTHGGVPTTTSYDGFSLNVGGGITYSGTIEIYGYN